MGDLVLKTRVAVTKRNLHRVQDLSQMLEKRAAGLSDFLSLPVTLYAEILDIQDEDYDVVLKRIRREYGDDEELVEAAQSVNTRLDTVRRHLREHQTEAKRLRAEMLQLLKLKQDIRDMVAERVKTAEYYSCGSR